MFIWDILTGVTDVLEVIFGMLTGVVSILATLATLNERLLLFAIDSFQTATDEVYDVAEFMEKLFTCQLSREDFHHYGLETFFETLNNTCDRILCWFLRVFQQFLNSIPIGLSLASIFAVLAVIHRKKWIRCLKYLRQKICPTLHFVLWDTNDAREGDWNANLNLDGNNEDHGLRAETLGGGRDSSSDSGDAHSAFTEETADSHGEQFTAYRDSSRKNIADNVQSQDRLLCVICQDKSKSVLVLPCRHLCMCEACAIVINSNADLPKICPLCRTGINRLISVYV